MSNSNIIADLFMNMSEVSLVLSKPAIESLKKEIRAIVNPDIKKEVQQLFSDAEVFRYVTTGETLFYWHEISWLSEVYTPDSSFDVMFVESFLESLPDDEYHFIRLGTDDNDIEEYGCYPDNFDSNIFKKLCIRKNAGKRIKMPLLA